MNKVYDEARKAIDVVAYLRDFHGNVETWKKSFYEVWRYQMTWGFAYKIEVNESRERGVFLHMIVSTSYAEQVRRMLENLGYKWKEGDAKIGIVYGVDHEDLDDVDELVIEW